MNNHFAIAVDSGKHTTKSVFSINGNLHKYKFRTLVQEVQELGVELTPTNQIVELDGKTFLIGDMNSEAQSNYDISKQSIEHLLCIYLAITKYLIKIDSKNNGIPNIRLAVNVPLNIYKNSVLKAEYEKFIQNQQKTISLRVNGRAFIFRIDKIILLPEGTGPVYQRINEFKSKRSLIIDVGGLNSNYCMFEGLVPMLDSMVIGNSGINILRSKIAEKMASHYGITVSDADVEHILKEGYLYVNGVKQEESKVILQKLIETHVTEIFNFAKSRSITFNNISVIFCGGGSLLLKDTILRQFPTAVIEQDSQYANALSFFRILEVKQLV
ncbi:MULTISPECIES: ParM/StbA family protein [Lysinibacillus]|uniref:ParM/StbA family protein n=1 Tax=Lysinibacillus TaxID=400634 RepID=UPI00214BFD32|nr:MULTISPECIES: ParM/StbA family protein [Lysinibacillus]UUV23265.1 ParM/StbA family protein [Lysinibacillus sp. FN11]UYB46130.1 ParM/StbA family protein [Lysinibacillus capsici]